MGIEERKADHIRICLEEDVEGQGITSGFERYRFVHQALPEMDLAQVDTSIELWGKRLKAPLLISSMTGGAEGSGEINRNLALAAQALGLAIGVGSQRAALEQPHLAASYKVREHAPDALVFANLGAVQLNYGYGVDECRRAVEMVGADALILHLNSMQEAVQPEGDTNFAGLAARIEQICRVLEVPVVAKEVGWGISMRAARLLWEAGVAAIDVAGAGGTSWSRVEAHRIEDQKRKLVAEAFAGWGIPTANSLLMVWRGGVPSGRKLFASGGIKNGVDAAKALALGADMVGLARPFLKAAAISAETVADLGEVLIEQLKVAMFGAGAHDLASLRRSDCLVEA